MRFAGAADDFDLALVLRDAVDALEGRKGGVLWAVNASNGERQAEIAMDSIPVFDGLIAANRQLYVSLKDGSVVCYASPP